MRGAAQGASLPAALTAPGGGPRAPSPCAGSSAPRPARPQAPPHLGRVARGGWWGRSAEGPLRGHRGVPGQPWFTCAGQAGRRRGPGAPAAAASCAGAEPGVAHRGGSSGCSGHADPGFIAEPQREGAPRAGMQRLLPSAASPPWPSRSERLRSPTKRSRPRPGSPFPPVRGALTYLHRRLRLPPGSSPSHTCYPVGDWESDVARYLGHTRVGPQIPALDHVGVDPCAAFSSGAARGGAWTGLGLEAGERS